MISGLRTGYGVVYDIDDGGNPVYEGCFYNGQYQGYGREYLMGTGIYEGMFDMGVRE